MNYEDLDYIIERNAHNRLTPQESKERWEMLQKAGYDPKSKTVSDGRGGRIPIRFDRYKSGDIYAQRSYLSNREERDLQRYNSLSASTIPKKKDPVTGKISIDRDKVKKIEDRGKRAEAKDKYMDNEANSRTLAANRRTKYVNIDDDSLRSKDNLVSLSHELGHKNAAEKKKKLCT